MNKQPRLRSAWILTLFGQSLLSAWTNAQADLSLFGLQAILLVRIFKNLLRFMEIIIGMIKIKTLNNALCEYRIILNVLIVCLFL